jgi:hypothetical protein
MRRNRRARQTQKGYPMSTGLKPGDRVRNHNGRTATVTSDPHAECVPETPATSFDEQADDAIDRMTEHELRIVAKFFLGYSPSGFAGAVKIVNYRREAITGGAS